MRSRLIALVAALALVFAAGAVVAFGAGDLPSGDELVAAHAEVEWKQPGDDLDWDGPTTGGADDGFQPMASVVATLATITDGCGDGTVGQADIDDVVIELQDDGNWRFTVNLCSAYDLRDETGWTFNFATRATPSSTTAEDVVAWTTHYAALTHEVEYGTTYEPDAATYFNDSFSFFGLTWGRPDGDTLACAGRTGATSGDPDRFYTPSVSAATSFTVDIDPDCFGGSGRIWFGITSPGDSFTMAADSANLVMASGPTVARAAGSDRYATAVEISRRAYPIGSSALMTTTPLWYGNGGTLTVYLADAFNFPDALAGGGLMGQSDPYMAGPILFWNSLGGTVPIVTLREICRLQPTQIVALGGSAAVSDAALAAAEAAAASSDCLADYGLAR